MRCSLSGASHLSSTSLRGPCSRLRTALWVVCARAQGAAWPGGLVPGLGPFINMLTLSPGTGWFLTAPFTGAYGKDAQGWNAGKAAGAASKSWAVALPVRFCRYPGCED
jgi:hypothetical protein